MKHGIRPDYIFSYWIFAWYLFYWMGVPYSPKFALVLGLLENLIVLGSMFYARVKTQNILYFLVVMLFVKILPLWTLRQESIYRKDVIATVVLFLVYLVWVRHHLIVLIDSYRRMLRNDLRLPGMRFLDRVFP